MSFSFHARNYGFRHDERCVEVNVNHLAEVFNAHLFHWNTLDDTGIVDENVNRAKFFFNLFNKFFHLCFVGHVGNISACINAFSLVVG